MGYRFLGGVAGLAFILCGDEGEEVRRKWRMVRIRTREVERAGGESRRCRRGTGIVLFADRLRPGLAPLRPWRVRMKESQDSRHQ